MSSPRSLRRARVNGALAALALALPACAAPTSTPDEDVTASAASAARVALDLPRVEPQNDSWSCGVNSSTRLLRAYGHAVSYEALKAEFGKQSFTIPGAGRVELDIGLGGKDLAERLAKYEPLARSQDFATFDFAKKLLAEGKPVGALVYLGTAQQRGVEIPRLHWIVLAGFDDAAQTVTYLDTDDSPPRTMSYDTFQRQWRWDGWNLWNGKSTVRTWTSQLSVNFSGGQNGLVWIDRPLPPPSVAALGVQGILAGAPKATTRTTLSFEGKGVKSCTRERAFDEAIERCRALLGVASAEQTYVLFRSNETFWSHFWKEGWNERKCRFGVRDAVCASAYVP